MASRVSANLVRRDGKEPWGLRISGGRDFGAPITIQRVVPGGVAERCGVRDNDRLIQIMGQPTLEMCHRDAQMAIKSAGNSLQLDIERIAGPSQPKPDVAAGLQNLEIKGAVTLPSKPIVDLDTVNSTAQPWKPRKSIDGLIQDTSNFRPISATLPSQPQNTGSGSKPWEVSNRGATLPSQPKDTGSGSKPWEASNRGATLPSQPKDTGSGSKPWEASNRGATLPTNAVPPLQSQPLAVTNESGYQSVSSNVPGRGSTLPPRTVLEEGSLQDSGLRRTDHAPYRYPTPTNTSKNHVEEESNLSDSGLRRTDHAPFRYQPSPALTEGTRKFSAPVNSYKFQPPSAGLGHRGSDPMIKPHQQQEQTPAAPAPFSASFKPAASNVPPVLPKPFNERKSSMERNQNQFRPNSSPTNDVTSKTDSKPTEKATAVCYHCKEKIRGPFLMALERYYCPDHFRCAKCDVQLGKQPFISHQDSVYCLPDFREYIAPRCGKCGDPVDEHQLLAMDKVFHPQCFTCNMCKKPMANGSFRIGTDQLPYCEEDWKANFQVMCGRCNFPIEADEQFIDAMSKNYHVDCFVCTSCQTRLEGKPFYLRDEQPYCKDHIRTAR